MLHFAVHVLMVWSEVEVSTVVAFLHPFQTSSFLNAKFWYSFKNSGTLAYMNAYAVLHLLLGEGLGILKPFFYD